MEFNITTDLKKASRALGALKNQVPYAASVAMNNTAVDILKAEQSAMRRELDAPRNSTVKGVRVERSHKRRLTASVFIIKHIDKFLRYQIKGGTRPARGRAEAVPVNIRLNRYGNIPGRRQGKIAKLLNRPDTFSGSVKGVAGVWQRGKGRMRGSLKLLIAYEDMVAYKPRFHFYHHAERTARKVWARNFNKSISHAIGTAR